MVINHPTMFHEVTLNSLHAARRTSSWAEYRRNEAKTIRHQLRSGDLMKIDQTEKKIFQTTHRVGTTITMVSHGTTLSVL
jgi:hypothetical protein